MKESLRANDLLQEGRVESLVEAGRVPYFLTTTTVVLVFIPPEGTQLGDRIVHGAGVGFGDQGLVVFESPNGEARGIASLSGEVSTEQRDALTHRIQNFVRQRGISTPYYTVKPTPKSS